MINEDLKNQIQSRLQEFKNLSNEVHVKSDNEGKFVVTLHGKSKGFVIEHGYKNKDNNFENPGIISLLLADFANQRSYIIEMTECDLKLFPSLLSDAFTACSMFLQEKFSIKKRRWNPFIKEDIFFDDNSLVYRYAARTDKFHWDPLLY